MKIQKAFLLCGLSLALILCVGTAQAAWFMKVSQSTATVYKEPNPNAKLVTKLAPGQEVEVMGQGNGWYKVKIPLSEGYFVYGWVPKTSPGIQIRKGNAAPAQVRQQPKAPAREDYRPNQSLEEDEDRQKKQKRSTGRDTDAEYSRWENDGGNQFVRVFGGPVYSLKNYTSTGGFLYKFGVAYEIPFTQRMKMGFPLSYITGKGFSAVTAGLDTSYSLYAGPVAISPKIGANYEYYYGNGESFYALTGSAGISVEMAVSDSIQIGLEPINAVIMPWNSLSSLDKIPMNIRAESLLLVRFRW
jgi:hypothetical protein